MSATIFYHKLIVVSENNGERKILYLFSLYLFAQFTVSESWQNRTNILYLTTEILYPKTEMWIYKRSSNPCGLSFFNFVRTLRTTICKKSINTLRQIMDRIFHKTDCATLTIFWGMYSLAKVTTWQSSSIGCFFVAHF